MDWKKQIMNNDKYLRSLPFTSEEEVDAITSDFLRANKELNKDEEQEAI